MKEKNIPYVCCVKIKSGKRKGELCNAIISEKYEILIKNVKYYVCGRHTKIDKTEDIDIIKYKDDKPDNLSSVDNNKVIEKEIDIDINDNIIKDFNDKLDINKETDNNNYDKIDKLCKKKPCLQYIIYLISKDDNDICQFEDCQFAHNINIIYT